MPTYPVLRLKADRDMSLRNRHHAIFRTSFAQTPDVPNGAICEVRSAEDEFLCFAMINTRAYICGRAFSFEEGVDPLEALKKNMKTAIELRAQFFTGDETNAIRLINAEGDGIPGLILDKYDDVFVVQFTTLGMDKQRAWIVNVLGELCQAKRIYEMSTGSSRKGEGLEPRRQWLRGSGDTKIPVMENGMKFIIDLAAGQKTGLFLDQREARALVRQFAKGRTVLDCCSYVGGFSVAALLGGAVSADAVDYDEAALATAAEHVAMNGIEASRFTPSFDDVFDFLRNNPHGRTYDFIILDPPAFAKSAEDMAQARTSYIDLNRMGMQALTKGGFLLTCSCSYQVSRELFQDIVLQAAKQAKKSVRILQGHHQAYDHPVNIYYPESDYLKSLLLWVE